MTRIAPGRVHLFRMEEARRQTQRQFDLLERRISRRLTAIKPKLRARQTLYWRGRSPSSSAFFGRYRALMAALTAERQHELDALSGKLARQDMAIAEFREHLCHEPARAA